jgi:hypothetical protein
MAKNSRICGQNLLLGLLCYQDPIQGVTLFGKSGFKLSFVILTSCCLTPATHLLQCYYCLVKSNAGLVFLDMCSELLKTTLKKLCIVVIFGISFGYIEAAVVVYLRTIFHPDGFTFPLTNFGAGPLWRPLLFTEIGREAATIVLILTAVWLFGQSLQQRFAYFLTIFAVWDIFYYVWLKVLINWPASIMDWDILFLIPITWASPVLAPVLISVTLLFFAIIILYRCGCDRPLKVTSIEWLVFSLAGFILVTCFCIAGLHIAEPDFQSHFYWLLFAVGYLLAIALFLRCLFRPDDRKEPAGVV